jgi:hypothetical protein
MTHLKVKWSSLTKDQRNQANDFYQEELKKGPDKRIVVLNQKWYTVNPYSGSIIFRKDY